MSESPAPAASPVKRRLLLLGGITLVAAVAAAGTAALLVNIADRKAEARLPFVRVVEVSDEIDDPAVWGKNFPSEYDGYKRTVEMRPTRFAGSEGVPRVATSEDPRTVVARSRTDSDPRLKVMWAGYAFAADYRERRGHAYMLEDQLYTERQRVVKQPGTCLNCHASMVVPYRKAGGGDAQKGFDAINRMPYAEAVQLASRPIACIDCHDPKTMALRITRPAFVAGIRALKAAQGVPDYDVNTMATRQELRSYVCAQCHVEYYFQGPEKRLVFPWHKGVKVDDILAYYEEVGHSDWTHKETGAKALKAQHPEFELWSTGLHARAGVACADCHMPYVREGAHKISDHHIRSPLLNINRSCQTCHKWPESELKARVETIQERNEQLRNVSMDALVALIEDIKAAQAAGAAPAQLDEARAFQRRAQFLIDYNSAENSDGFHSPQEGARMLALALDHARRGQQALRAHPAACPAPTSPPAAATAPATAPASQPTK